MTKQHILRVAGATGAALAAVAPLATPVFAAQHSTLEEDIERAKTKAIAATEWEANSVDQVKQQLADQKIKSVDDLSKYKVVWGDTLSVIAEHFGVSVDEVVKKFNISDPNMIVTGVTMSDQAAYVQSHSKDQVYWVSSTPHYNPLAQSVDGTKDLQAVENKRPTAAQQEAEKRKMVHVNDQNTPTQQASTQTAPAAEATQTNGTSVQTTGQVVETPAQPAQTDNTPAQTAQPTQTAQAATPVAQTPTQTADNTPAQPAQTKSLYEQAKEIMAAKEAGNADEVKANYVYVAPKYTAAVGYTVLPPELYTAYIDNARPGDVTPGIIVSMGTGSMIAENGTKAADGNWYDAFGQRFDPYGRGKYADTKSAVEIQAEKEAQQREHDQTVQNMTDAYGAGAQTIVES